MCKVIGYDSFSEPPGIHLDLDLEVGTCRTVRIAMLKNVEREKKTSLQ